MLHQIMVANPPAAGKSKGKGKKMAAKTKEVVKYRKPSEKAIKKAARAMLASSKSRAKAGLLGMDLGESVKGGFFVFLGILVAQFSAKKFAEGGGATEDWTWKNYLIGPVAGLVISYVLSTVLKGKSKHGQWIVIGSLGYVAWQFFRNEVVSGNDKLEEYFAGIGADEDESPYPEVDGADWDDAGDGDIAVGEDGRRYVMQDGQWLPAADEHRVPSSMGDDITNVPASMGADMIEDVPASMGDIAEQVSQEFDTAYSNASGF